MSLTLQNLLMFLLAWWWLRSHHFYFHFRAEMIQFSCTSFAKCVVQPSTFRFKVGAREEPFCICNRADDRSWTLTRICRWCWTYWWRKLQLLEVWWDWWNFCRFFELDLFSAERFLQVNENLEVKKINPSIVLQWNRLLTKTELPKSSCFSFKKMKTDIFPKMKLFLHAAHLSKSKNQQLPRDPLFHLSGLWSLYYGAVPSRLATKMQTEADGFFKMNS